MTADERLEALLNRAGQTISDLPKSDGKHLTYDRESRSSAEHGVFAYAKQSGYVDVIDCLAMHQDYILHLTDVIDRMETALENVCGERDYLLQIDRMEIDCWTCTNSDSGMECHRPEGCVLNDEGRCVGYEYAGMPEDWRPEE